mmetsp:Transcript_74163/g.169868  ORF Transcript_74163/g.169868 Transcript_74163/m.169868 type:complete len:227 (+) Transcript_74163:130-810(+)
MIVERNHLERLFFQWRSRCSLQRKSLTGVEDEVARVQKAFLAVPRLGPEGGAEIGDWSDHTSEVGGLAQLAQHEHIAERAVCDQSSSCESQAFKIREQFQGLRTDAEREHQLSQLLTRQAQHLHTQIVGVAASTSAKQDSILIQAATPLFDKKAQARWWSCCQPPKGLKVQDRDVAEAIQLEELERDEERGVECELRPLHFIMLPSAYWRRAHKRSACEGSSKDCV